MTLDLANRGGADVLTTNENEAEELEVQPAGVGLGQVDLDRVPSARSM